jgi:hypothetical protein
VRAGPRYLASRHIAIARPTITLSWDCHDGHHAERITAPDGARFTMLELVCRALDALTRAGELNDQYMTGIVRVAPDEVRVQLGS